MKQKDIALIILIVFFGAVISVVVSKYLIVPPKNRQQEVEKVVEISQTFKVPVDPRYFNNNSINPTQLIRIGENANPDPFKDNTP